MAVDIERRRAYHRHYMRLRRAKERELAGPPAVKGFLQEWDGLFSVKEAACLFAGLLRDCASLVSAGPVATCASGPGPH